jgi:hypothetical protein
VHGLQTNQTGVLPNVVQGWKTDLNVPPMRPSCWSSDHGRGWLDQGGRLARMQLPGLEAVQTLPGSLTAFGVFFSRDRAAALAIHLIFSHLHSAFIPNGRIFRGLMAEPKSVCPEVTIAEWIFPQEKSTLTRA